MNNYNEIKNKHIEKNISRSETIIDDILEYIVKNKLKADDKLPNEFELAEILGVGRSTVREGVKALISRNILEIRRGDGTYVSPKQGRIDDPLGLMFFEDKYCAGMDFLELRILIEPTVASLAAKNVTKEDVLEIEQACLNVDEMILKGENHLHKDLEFHTIIAEKSGNIAMLRLVPIIGQAVFLFGNINRLSLVKETMETHHDIVDAIKIGDSAGARDAMYMHLIQNRKSMKLELDKHKQSKINLEE